MVFPGDQMLKDGDIVSVDCGVLMNGFYGDSAYTFPVGEVDEEVLKLLNELKNHFTLELNKQLLESELEILDMLFKIMLKVFGYSVVRDLVGHGVGRNLHEKPEVPNYGRRGSGMKLKEGMVLAIEPMINLGVKEVIQEKDGWTIRTAMENLQLILNMMWQLEMEKQMFYQHLNILKKY